MPMLSPDERRIAVRVVDQQTRTRDIWLLDRTRDVSTRFTFDKGNENYPLWSPDGRRIAYWSDATGASGITIKQLSGSGEAELLTPFSDEVVLKDWSRDGNAIAFDFNGATGTDIWVVSTTGDRKPQPFLNGTYDEFDARFSPDGRYMAYVSNESGREEVYVQTFPDRSEKWQVSTRGGYDPRWSANGHQMYYLSTDQQMMSVPIRLSPAFDPGTPAALFTARVFLPGNARIHYAVTADDQTFFLFSPADSRSVPTTTVAVNWMAEMSRR